MEHKRVIKFRKSILVLAVQYLRLFLPVLGFYLGSVLVIQTLTPRADSLLRTLRSGYYLVSAVLVLEMVRRYFDNLYVLGRKRVGHKRGMMSIRLKKISIQYGDIRQVEWNQSLLGRILGYGDVSLGTAATDKNEITFAGVNRPKQLAKYIEYRLQILRGRRTEESKNKATRSEVRPTSSAPA